MANKVLYIPNNKTLNHPFCRLELAVKTYNQHNKKNNQNSVKVPKVVKPTNEKIVL